MWPGAGAGGGRVRGQESAGDRATSLATRSDSRLTRSPSARSPSVVASRVAAAPHVFVCEWQYAIGYSLICWFGRSVVR